MIKYEWRTGLGPGEAAELAALLDRAAYHDAEAEHNSIDFGAVQRAMDAGTDSVRHLVIWMLPHTTALDQPDDPERIAGLIRLEFTGTREAEVTAVVDPMLRSIGIMTLLLEQAGVQPDPQLGWLGSGAHVLRAWARGNHPAAGRISKRFLIPSHRRIWKLVRPLDGLEGTAGAPEAAGTYTLDLTPVLSEGFGPCATIVEFAPAPGADSAAVRALLDGAAATVAEAGLAAVAVHIDPGDRTLVNACRLSGFQHDRTDVCYQMGES